MAWWSAPFSAPAAARWPSATPARSLDGQYTYTASLVDDAGNQSPPSGPVTISIVTVQGDYTDSGYTDLAVFDRVSPGVLDTYIAGGITPPGGSNAFGSGSLDIPFQGDLDGDGKTDLILYRPSTSTVVRAGSRRAGSPEFNFGAPGDIPVVGDFDKVGHDELARLPAEHRPVVRRRACGCLRHLRWSDRYPRPAEELLRHRPGYPGGVPAEHGAVVRGGSVERDQLRRGRGRPDPVVQLLRQRRGCAGGVPAEHEPVVRGRSGQRDQLWRSRRRPDRRRFRRRRPRRDRCLPAEHGPVVRRRACDAPFATFGGPADIPLEAPYLYRVAGLSTAGIPAASLYAFDFGATAAGAVGGVELILHAGGGDFLVGRDVTSSSASTGSTSSTKTTSVVSSPTQGKRPKQEVKHTKNHLHDLAIASLQGS